MPAWLFLIWIRAAAENPELICIYAVQLQNMGIGDDRLRLKIDQNIQIWWPRNRKFSWFWEQQERKPGAVYVYLHIQWATRRSSDRRSGIFNTFFYAICFTFIILIPSQLSNKKWDCFSTSGMEVFRLFTFVKVHRAP